MNLKWIITALAANRAIQHSLYPQNIPVAEELALDFESAMTAISHESKSSWSTDQQAAIIALDQKMAMLSGTGHDDIWLDEHALTHPEWDVIRSLARNALIAFEWQYTVLMPVDSLYVNLPDE
ncbi:hypothetical protein KSF73_05625 [Burkholderiaceae bacterium DAT-1]|nr:hypothetical protein [Burkholderiaceae bacterium DAT-1]